jgi:hypothetical protein
MDEFGEIMISALRLEGDLEYIGEGLGAVVEETMQPEIVNLWLRKGGSKR